MRTLEELRPPKTGRPARVVDCRPALSAITRLYEFGIDEGVLERSPVARVGRPRRPQRADRVNPHIRHALVTTALDAGVELRGITWCQLMLDTLADTTAPWPSDSS